MSTQWIYARTHINKTVISVLLLLPKLEFDIDHFSRFIGREVTALLCLGCPFGIVYSFNVLFLSN